MITAVIGAITALLAFLVVRLYSRAFVAPLAASALVVAAVLWYVVPVVLVLSVPWSVVVSIYPVEQGSLLTLMSLECGAACAAIATLHLGRPTLRWVARLDAPLSPGRERLIVIAAIVVSCASRIAVNRMLGSSYFERNAYIASAPSALASLGTLSFAGWIASGVAFAALCDPERAKYGRWTPRLLLGWLAYTVFDDVVSGSRIALLYPAIAVLFRVASARSRLRLRRKVVLVAAAAAVTVVIGGAAVVALSDIRGEHAMSGATVLGATGVALTSSATETLLTEVNRQLAIKFSGMICGRVLLDRSGEGAGGWRPYAGALLAFVPRAVLPEKPVPGSTTTDYSGHPARLTAVLMGYSDEYGSVGVSPLAVSVWQVGQLGPLLFVACAAWYFRLLNSALGADGVVCRGIGCAMLTMPSMSGVFASPDAMILVGIRASLMFFGLATIRVLARGAALPYRAPRRPGGA